MKIFKLPDLGEGLPSAEIHHWHVKVGDVVKTDQTLVSVETAKALVDIPSPREGKIMKLYGNPGDVIQTHAPLVEFETGEEEKETHKNTVVGELPTAQNTKIPDAVHALAKKLKSEKAVTPEGYTPLHGTRRTMAIVMAESHASVVPVSLFDDVDIQSWPDNSDVTARVIIAIAQACKKEPSLNAWFDSITLSKKLFSDVHIGLAVDTEEGLFVPTLRNAEKQNAESLRKNIDHLKQAVKARKLSPEDLQGCTFMLTNFGMFAGRYATPMLVPPCIAILGIGKIYGKMLPLSLTFDHRAATGGEASRFLGEVMKHLS